MTYKDLRVIRDHNGTTRPCLLLLLLPFPLLPFPLLPLLPFPLLLLFLLPLLLVLLLTFTDVDPLRV